MKDVIILCGGKGSRLAEETYDKPKPMLEIGGRPILWHIMKHYSHYGYHRFILALGYKSEQIKSYFYNYRILNSDFTLQLHPHKEPSVHGVSDEAHWEITLVDTGIDTLKGGRIKRLEKYIKSELFHLTYGDGVSNVDIKSLERFAKAHGKIGTLTGVHPPSRFGEIIIEGDLVKRFEEKPQLSTGLINGGFFVFRRDFLDYLTPDTDCDFEFQPLQRLSTEGELKVFKHDGFWQCMDTVREMEYLNKLWAEGSPPWKTWK